MSVATIANWGANFVVTVSFLTLLSVLDAGTFFLFGFLTLVALAYFFKQVPETKNRPLPEIERGLGLPHGAMSDIEHPAKRLRDGHDHPTREERNGLKAITVIPGEPEQVQVSDRPDPPSVAGTLLVQGRLLGISGTDVDIVENGYGWPPPGRDWLVIGHESLGTVLEAPEGSGFAPGDLVAGIVRRPDPVPCGPCGQDEWDCCRNGRYTERGIKELDGYGAQRWRIEPEYAIRLEAGLGDCGVLLESASVLAKAREQTDRIFTRATWRPEVALVTGAGPIGLFADLGATFHTGDIQDLQITPDVVDEDEDELVNTYRQLGARLEGHPTPVLPGVDVATGSLGQGLPDAVVCLAGKYLDKLPYHVWMLCGDSEPAEGSIWKTLDKASFYRLGILTAIIDINRLEQRGPTELAWDVDPLHVAHLAVVDLPGSAS